MEKNNKNISRRDALKFVGTGLGVSVLAAASGCAQNVKSSTVSKLAATAKNINSVHEFTWNNTHDRVWLGGEFWANPMEDWRVKDGFAETINPGGNRSIHSLTHQLYNTSANFTVSVHLQNRQPNQNDGGGAIRFGARSELNDYKSNCFVQSGLDVGVVNNQLFIGDERGALTQSVGSSLVELIVSGRPQVGAVMISAEVRLVDSKQLLGSLSLLVSGEQLLGNLALVSNAMLASTNFQSDLPEHNGSRYRFNQWRIAGEAFTYIPTQAFGPILWTMYTLSDSRSERGFILKLSALLGPLGVKDNQQVDLQVKRDNKWTSIQQVAIDPKAAQALFEVPNWDESITTPFRVIYVEQHKDGTNSVNTYDGSVRANPIGRPLQMASMTCQNDYAFPYAPVAQNLINLDPDLMYFSGDQLYESHGGFGYVRAPAERATLNYLRMFYQFGWAFRDAMRHQPTVCLPDDHDVLQGNIWGEGGAPMQHIERDPSASILGGYIQPVDMVNVVHKTNTGHHPAPHDATPTESGITSYYGEMIYGNVGFAILADRQWKTAPERIDVTVGETGNDEAPAFINPAFNVPGLALLGERQEAFLTTWSKDWRGHELKAVLSQTVFAGIATHQPNPNRYLKYDFDSNGWPAAARDTAIDCMRESGALHICGDTHLGTLSQYGVKQQRDSNWAFCSPAIAAGWPRWWKPDAINEITHQNRPQHNLPNTGEYLDAFGNKVYVYAVANPVVGKSKNRYVQAHEKASGFGVIDFDTQAGNYTMSAYKFLIDIEDGQSSNQFTGWPVTIHKDENKGINKLR